MSGFAVRVGEIQKRARARLHVGNVCVQNPSKINTRDRSILLSFIVSVFGSIGSYSGCDGTLKWAIIAVSGSPRSASV